MLTQKQTQTQQQKIDAKVIMANAILQLSGLELEQSIEQELAENPALELEDEDPCSGCELAPFACKNCQHSKQQEEDVQSEDLSVHDLEYSFDLTFDPDDQNDPVSWIQTEITLQEHLREQLGNAGSGRLYEIGEYLINYINESGYLKCDLLELTLELDASDEEIAQGVSIIQTLDPPGVGARDLRECLLIQLRYLADDGRGNPIAERIVGDCWDEMKGRKYNRIARRLKVKPEQVTQAVDFIQTKLNPYPAGGFRPPWDYKPSDTKTAVRPDVIIHRTRVGYEIEVVANEHLALTINPYYSRAYSELRNKSAGKYSDDEKKHVFEYVERADLFVKNLNQRRKTLKNITKYLAEAEHGFLDTGSKLFLRPLTRVKVAKALRMHESTVSRATANKYVQLPSQEVVSFDFFFRSAQSVMDKVAQLIANEDSTHPLSDQEIADVLKEQGYPIARRTVVKYREAHKILSSRQRRR